jgi:hypothetical protein
MRFPDGAKEQVEYRWYAIASPENACLLTSQTAKSRWKIWLRAYGSGHVDQGLVGGLARKAHRQSEDRESRGLVYRGIESAETSTEVWLRPHKRWSYEP